MDFRTIGSICLLLATLLIIYVLVTWMNDEPLPDSQPDPVQQGQQTIKLHDYVASWRIIR